MPRGDQGHVSPQPVTRHFCPQTVLRIWDCLFSEGSKILFRVALTLIKHHQAFILEASSVADTCERFKEITRGSFVTECHTFMQVSVGALLPVQRPGQACWRPQPACPRVPSGPRLPPAGTPIGLVQVHWVGMQTHLTPSPVASIFGPRWLSVAPVGSRVSVVCPAPKGSSLMPGPPCWVLDLVQAV